MARPAKIWTLSAWRGPVRVLAPVCLVMALTGCVSLSRSAPVAALSPEASLTGRVDEVVLLSGPSTVSPQFDAIFRERVKAKLAGCARGDRPLRLEASVERLTRTNPVITAVVAGANVLRGTARLVDAGTGEPAGEYQIGRTVVGGRVAAIVMAQAEEQLSDAFGEELCRQAFARTPSSADRATPQAVPAPVVEPAPAPAAEPEPPAPG